MKKILLEWFSLLTHPQKGFVRVKKKTLESVLGEYMKVLLLAGFVAGLTVCVSYLVRAAYFSLVRGVDIEYLRLVNYALGMAAGTFFFWLFAGTVLFFVAVLIFRVFIPASLSDRVKFMSVSTAPVLFFGWITPSIVPVLLVWSMVLLFGSFSARSNFRQ